MLAEYARIGVVDKLFTRVGASDNISMGESTFMVEMNETCRNHECKYQHAIKICLLFYCRQMQWSSFKAKCILSSGRYHGLESMMLVSLYRPHLEQH